MSWNTAHAQVQWVRSASLRFIGTPQSIIHAGDSMKVGTAPFTYPRTKHLHLRPIPRSITVTRSANHNPRSAVPAEVTDVSLLRAEVEKLRRENEKLRAKLEGLKPEVSAAQQVATCWYGQAHTPCSFRTMTLPINHHSSLIAGGAGGGTGRGRLRRAAQAEG